MLEFMGKNEGENDKEFQQGQSVEIPLEQQQDLREYQTFLDEFALFDRESMRKSIDWLSEFWDKFKTWLIIASILIVIIATFVAPLIMIPVLIGYFAWKLTELWEKIKNGFGSNLDKAMSLLIIVILIILGIVFLYIYKKRKS